MIREHILRARVSEAVGSILCANPVINKMDAKQLAAMHVFKHEVLAAFHRVYLEVPANYADPLFAEFIGKLPAILKTEDNVTPSA